MGQHFEGEKLMGTITRTKRIYVGDVMAELDVVMSDEPDAWGPHAAPSELDRIDEVRRALKSGNLEAASKSARLYSVKPLAI
jgi:hypothetical protein